MGKNFEKLTDKLKEFIRCQKMFFVGTAPSIEGEVHIAPKGYDILKIVDDNNLVYLDYYGSENDTAQHLSENKKISLMWCSFDEKPCILRAYGLGELVSKGTEEFNKLHEKYFEDYHPKMIRQIFKVKIHRVMTTCGFGVPLMKYEGDRKTLHDLSDKMLVKNPAGKLFAKFFNTEIDVN